MTAQEFNNYLDSGKRVVANSEVHKCMHGFSDEARRITFRLNSEYRSMDEIRDIFSILTGKSRNDTLVIFPPFYTDCGKNITLGERVFINEGCCFQDQGGIEIGDDCLIGQQVVIATLNHDLKSEYRKDMLPQKVKIGKNVWIGAHATILPGVTIGDNAVIAAGAVVNKSVAKNTVVAGVPAKIIKIIE